MDRVAYYHAAKIRADCRQIYSKLLGRFLMVMILAPQHINVLYIASDSIRQWHITFFQEFFYSVTTDHFYARLYFEIWKRVAKQKVWIFVWICRTKKFTVLFFFNLFWLYMFINHRVIFSPWTLFRWISKMLWMKWRTKPCGPSSGLKWMLS